jgi:parallel beta-helix repeat protein
MKNEKSSPKLTNCTFFGNTANGSLSDGGGMNNKDNSNPKLTNCTFSKNSATRNGGGMYNKSSSSPTLTNCIIWDNTAGNDGSSVYNDKSHPTYSHCLVQEVTTPDENGNLDGKTDPLLNDDLSLHKDSKAINAGDNDAYLKARGDLNDFTDEKDLAGGRRLRGDNIDLGAYEYRPAAIADNYNLSNNNVIYDGESKSVTVKPNDGVDAGKVSEIYYGGSKDVPTDAGCYTITIDVLATIDYLEGKGLNVGTLTIQQKEVTVTASSHTITVGDVLPTPTVSYSGFVNSDNEAELFSDLPAAQLNVSDSQTAGTSVIDFSSEGTLQDKSNYKVKKYVKGALIITESTPQPNPTPQPTPTPTPNYEYFSMIVTETEGVTTNPGAGEHQVKYGDDFSISFAAKDGYSLHGMKLFANNMEQTVTVSEDGKTATATIAMPLADMLLKVELARTTTSTHLPPTPSQGGGDLIVSTTTDGITVSGLHVGTMLYIYNMTGQLVYQTKVDAESIVLPSFRGQGAILVNDGRHIKAVR